ncbi:Hypothetical_protein [Hexamita inflata]|uniref:Hypothetical_protein n=1 Tax=Hexamita inflata TaxID=28002 RepID=A0AA86UKU0_9EUKA|nr:Hypothetical protein HINF_LOCUS42782 [Hexamita inflata]
MQVNSFTKAAARLLNISCKDPCTVYSQVVRFLELNRESYVWFELAYVLNKPASAVKMFFETVYSKAVRQHQTPQQPREKEAESLSSCIESAQFTRQLEKLLQLTESD